MVDDLKKNAPEKRICIKTKSNNLQCKRMIEKAGGLKLAEEPTEYDRVIMAMIPKLEPLGLLEESKRKQDAMDRNNGISLFVYNCS